MVLTGATGMLGRNLEPLLHAKNYEVLATSTLRVDLRNWEDTHSLIRDFNPEIIIHLAARVGGIGANVAGGDAYFQENVDMDQSVFRAAIMERVPKLLYIGSSCMYPSNHTESMTEQHLWMGPLEKTNEPYALAKLMGTKYVQSVASLRKVAWRTLIASNLYGPFDHFGETKSHLIAAVIDRVYMARAQQSAVVEMWGSGRPRREFTYVYDFAEFIVGKIEEIETLPEILNVGIGEDYSVREYYEMISKILGFTGTINSNLERPDGVYRKLLDSSLARSHGWDPKTSIEIGLQKTIDHFLKEKGK